MFRNNERIPEKYTCDGENISPPLRFLDVPKNAKSLALIVEDPDSPSKVWVHWILWNLRPDIEKMDTDGIPDSDEGLNDFGRCGYKGPCPGSGVHRYQFKLYALDNILNLSSGSTKNEFEAAISGHVIDKAILTGLYSRQ